MEGKFGLKIDKIYFEEASSVLCPTFQAKIITEPVKEYDAKFAVVKRLPRKKKKWLKKYGGFEYYIQVLPKGNYGLPTEDDFIQVINSLTNNK